MIGNMSETPDQSPEPAPVAQPTATTTPTTTAPTPPPQRPYKHNRVNQGAALVGIVAGVVFIVVEIFGTGFMLGAHSGHGGRGGGERHHEMVMFHRGGTPRGLMGQVVRAGPDFGGAGGAGAAGAVLRRAGCPRRSRIPAAADLDRSDRSPGTAAVGGVSRILFLTHSRK